MLLFVLSQVVLLLIALLPRLVGLRVPKYVEIELAASPAVESPVEVDLDVAEPPLLTMRGPSAQRSLPFSSDIEMPSSV